MLILHYSNLTGDFEIMKLCDFGVSLSLNANGAVDTDAGEEYVGTSCWTAPEALCRDGLSPITNKADIFSFGLVLWEMIALKPPHFDESLIQDAAVADRSLDVSVTLVTDTSLCSILDVKYGKYGLYQEV
jgi:PDZ-binding kinase